MGLQSLLIKESLGKICNKGYIEFLYHGGRSIKEIAIDEKVIKLALNELFLTKEVLKENKMPFSFYNARCVGCHYNKICPVGSLKRSI